MDRSCATSDPECPVARAIAVLQEKWVLHIVHTLLDGPRGFNELGREVGGCNPTTLAQRLARLEELGLVARTDRPVGSSRRGYALTASGEALSDVIDAIQAWSLHHLHAGGPPTSATRPTTDDVRPRASGDDAPRLEPLQVEPLSAG
jgi:DNA-binding HxlR family transcriptional regulator